MKASNQSVSKKKAAYTQKTISMVILLMASIKMISCEEFIDIDVEKSKTTKDLVFSNDVTATSAVTGIYSDMYSIESSFASGGLSSIVSLCAISASELNYNAPNPEYASFESYSILPGNLQVRNLWESMYYSIYGANSVLEGLEKSTKVSNSIKNQLTGEALFVRAFSHFHLTNLFGDIPIITTTNYQENAQVTRQSKSLAYNQILKDLILAQDLLSDEYVTTDRVRPNKSTATALLSRLYLYIGDWTNAEIQSSSVIQNSKYSLPSNLDEVFLKNSNEAIWQLRPVGISKNTNEGGIFILTGAPTSSARPFSITSELLNAFEPNDTRKSLWTRSIAASGKTYVYPFKYKIRTGGTSSNPVVALSEYSMVFRLAEQYLIRAEARANQGNVAGSIADLDAIRARAKLPLLASTNPSISKEDLLIAIERERRIELFTEWGHRWFDLKRTEHVDIALSGKTGWKSHSHLYPIPQNEFNRNPKLGDQNFGYY